MRKKNIVRLVSVVLGLGIGVLTIVTLPDKSKTMIDYHRRVYQSAKDFPSKPSLEWDISNTNNDAYSIDNSTSEEKTYSSTNTTIEEPSVEEETSVPSTEESTTSEDDWIVDMVVDMLENRNKYANLEFTEENMDEYDKMAIDDDISEDVETGVINSDWGVRVINNLNAQYTSRFVPASQVETMYQYFVYGGVTGMLVDEDEDDMEDSIKEVLSINLDDTAVDSASDFITGLDSTYFTGMDKFILAMYYAMYCNGEDDVAQFNDQFNRDYPVYAHCAIGEMCQTIAIYMENNGLRDK